ncbi:MAG: SGNH/GDSL hydrolase family protein [Microthrixaceae bacterium]
MKVLERPKGADVTATPRQLHVRDLVKRSLPPSLLAFTLLLFGRPVGAFVAAAAALLLVALSIVMPAIALAFDRALSTSGQVAANLVSVTLTTMIWTVAVLPAWLWNRLTGNCFVTSKVKGLKSYWDQTSIVHGRSSSGAIIGSSKMVGVESTRQRGLRRALANTLLCAAAIAALATMIPRTRPAPERAGRQAPGPYVLQVHPQFLPGAPPDVASGRIATEYAGVKVDRYTHEHEPWAPRYFGELNEVPYRPDLILGSTLKDFIGTYLNISDGKRVSYSPRNPKITVWFFGGSTMFGVGQRDDHTIPSEVAKLAAKDGIKIKPEHFGVSAYVNWQETEKFEQMLTLGDDRPDLAVFYDGLNDNALASERSNIGDTFTGVIRRKSMSTYEQDLSQHIVGNADPVPSSPARLAAEIDSAASQYRRGVQLARALGRAYAVPVVHFWQPEPFSKEPNEHDRELWNRIGFDPKQSPVQRQRYDAVRKKSGVEPIDLSRSLDHLKQPVYFDAGHTNEFGARTVAKAMYENLRPKLLELTEPGG